MARGEDVDDLQADAIGEFQADADCPRMLPEQRALLAHDPALVPSRPRWADHWKV
ncbi:MAG: hypothetical protein ACI807_002096 [Paracoccaceae bacterium]|jgi:hypothetical protein